MDLSCFSDKCSNCAVSFDCGSQIFKKFSVVDEINYPKTNEIEVIDAVLYVYGYSAANLASAFLEGENSSYSLTRVSEISAYIIEHGISLCSYCISVFKEVYVANHNLKKLGTEAAILTKVFKKFSPTCIKVEVCTKENFDTTDQYCDNRNDDMDSESIPVKQTDSQPMVKKRTVSEEERHRKALKFYANLMGKKKPNGGRRKQRGIQRRMESYLRRCGLPVDKAFKMIADHQSNRGNKAKNKVSTAKNCDKQNNYCENETDNLTTNNYCGIGIANLDTESIPIEQNECQPMVKKEIISEKEQRHRKETKVIAEENFNSNLDIVDGSQDLFDAFNFEEDGGHKQNEEDLFSETKPTNDILAISSDAEANIDDNVRLGYPSLLETKGHPKNISKELVDEFAIETVLRRSSRTKKEGIKHSMLPNTLPDNVSSHFATSDMTSETIKMEQTERQPIRQKRNFIKNERPKNILPLAAKTTKKNSRPWTIIKFGTRAANLRKKSCLQKSKPANGNSEIRSDEQQISDADSGNEKDDKEITRKPTISEKQKHDPKSLKCICGQIFIHLHSLKKHEEKNHAIQDPLHCDFCGHRFEMNHLLYAHKLEEHFEEMPKIQFKCDLCLGSFQTEKILKAHLDHQLCRCAPKILQCSCGKSFGSLRTLCFHERKHETQDSVVCDICGDSFTYRYLLYAHKSRIHSELPQILIKCDFCELKFISKSALGAHIKHCHSTNHQPFICEKCGKSCKTNHSLIIHRKVVHGDEGLDKELFKCKECGKGLKNSHSLKKHMNIVHYNQKTFVCELCGKTTKNMTNMRIHMVVHDPNRVLKRKPPTSIPSGSH